MRRLILAFGAVFGLFLLLALFVSPGVAQINGVPSSVTSPGFGGHAVNGTPPSVTSVGPRGYAPGIYSPYGYPSNPYPSNPGGQISSNVPRGDHDGGRDRHHHPHSHSYPSYGEVYAVPVAVPYPVPADAAADAATNDDSEDQGGPTIFDRRGAGEESYVPPVKNVPVAHAREDQTGNEPEPPPEPTVLIYKDGHQMEVGNYAIVGATLFDLTPGHPRRVALAELDLPATQKLNDDHGVNFQLPPGAQAN